MTRATLRRRIEKLEAASPASQEVTLPEAVVWSYEPAEKRTADNPDYVSFCKRLERSQLGRLLSDSQRRYRANSNQEKDR